MAEFRMEDRYASILARVLGLVESSLDRKLCLDALAVEAGLSKYHLHRVFRALTGYPLSEYVRRRKLTASLDDLVGTDRSILDIALSYGFDYEQSYGRAFRSLWGLSPGQYRQERPILPATDPLESGDITPVGEHGAFAPPLLVIKPAMTLCGVRRLVTSDDLVNRNTAAEIGNDFFFGMRKAITEPYHHGRYYAHVEYTETSSEDWYTACAELRGEPRGKASEGMVYKRVESRRYRRFTLVSRVHPSRLAWMDVLSLYDWIFDAWMPANRDSLAGAWHLEYIDLASSREDYGEFNVLVPVT